MVIKNVSTSKLHRTYFNRQGRELNPGEHSNVSGGASILDVMNDPTFLKDIGAVQVANKADIAVVNADIPLKTVELGTNAKLVYGKVSSLAGLKLPACASLVTAATPERKVIVFVDRAEQALLEDALGMTVPTDVGVDTEVASLYASPNTNALYNGALGDVRFAYTGKDAVAYTNQQDLTVGMPDSSGGLTVELTLPTGYTMSACVSLTGGLTATRTDGDTISLVFAKTTSASFSGIVQLTINGNDVQVPFTSGATAIAVTAGLGSGAKAAVAYKGDVAVTNAGATVNITSTVDISSIVVHADITATIGVTGLTAALVVPANVYAGAKSYEVSLLDAEGATIFKFDIVEAAMAQPTFTINVNGGGAAGIVGAANTAITAAQNSVVYVSTVPMSSATAVFGATTVAGVLSNSDKTATFTITANTDEVVAPVYNVSLLDADGARYLAVTLTQAVAAPAIQAKHAIGGTYVRVAPGGVFGSIPAGGEAVYIQTIDDIESCSAGGLTTVIDGGKKFVAVTVAPNASNVGYRVSLNRADKSTFATIVLGQGTYMAGVASVGDIEVMSAEEPVVVAQAVEAPVAEVVTEAAEVVTEVEAPAQEVVEAPVVEPVVEAPKAKKSKKQD